MTIIILTFCFLINISFNRFMDIYFNEDEMKKTIQDIYNDAVYDSVGGEIGVPTVEAPAIPTPPLTDAFAILRYFQKKNSSTSMYDDSCFQGPVVGSQDNKDSWPVDCEHWVCKGKDKKRTGQVCNIISRGKYFAILFYSVFFC
jgi:hypothetical protein